MHLIGLYAWIDIVHWVCLLKYLSKIIAESGRICISKAKQYETKICTYFKKFSPGGKNTPTFVAGNFISNLHPGGKIKWKVLWSYGMNPYMEFSVVLIYISNEIINDFNHYLLGIKFCNTSHFSLLILQNNIFNQTIF